VSVMSVTEVMNGVVSMSEMVTMSVVSVTNMMNGVVSMTVESEPVVSMHGMSESVGSHHSTSMT